MRVLTRIENHTACACVCVCCADTQGFSESSLQFAAILALLSHLLAVAIVTTRLQNAHVAKVIF